ncbi:MAG TPA: DUF134 domain-containing protein [Vicinamibacterales bacterium]|nr:DUF134 domain-containing protein [Vicinamibacterales bacterium]HOG28706.1 DUF134 domain-containing protein [Vicinamibacterales bacterium]HOQ60491.1 DUF134 domain-containing protein [Vicinamibacterales bacterium]HPK71620.1 DUF134 domain-containing protein [Vicinamibacterales bacterium]HPW20313.1 DUF134 domain-containing protein [Vicinamibacterales bacterium]
MPRPFCHRHVAGQPAAPVFKPAGVPALLLGDVVMTLDEFEALRLADLERLYHKRAAEQMGVSRPTFSRIVDSARVKIADAIVHGKALRIEGGPVRLLAGPRRCCRLHEGRSRPPTPAGADGHHPRTPKEETT